MQHINWVQQNENYVTRYHVLQWKTSHFHEPFSIQASGGAKQNQSAGAGPQAKEIQTETEGLGFGQSDRGSGRIGLGLGLENSLANAVMGNERGHGGLNISASGVKAQEAGMEADRTVAQSVAHVHVAEHTVTPATETEVKSENRQREQANRENTTVAESGRGNIRNRLQESAARLREAYQRQKEKAAKMLPLRQIRPKKKEETIQRGTRTADREAMLAMQAENHYLLDSYDQNGNYSMLGKK